MGNTSETEQTSIHNFLYNFKTEGDMNAACWNENNIKIYRNK